MRARPFLLAAGLLCGAALLQAQEERPPCIVYTDIQELRDKYVDQLQRACGEGIQAISITGDHERVVYEIQYADDWGGRVVLPAKMPPLPGFLSVEAASTAAKTCGEILRWIYPVKEFIHHLRDGKGHPVCVTKIAEDGSGATACVHVVGEDAESKGGVS